MKAELRNAQRKIPLRQASLVRDCLDALKSMGLHGHPEVFVLFCGTRRMRTLNRAFMGKDKPTDVLSFPMHERGKIPRSGRYMIGDIVIAPEIALRQARENGISLNDELRRLLVHGLMHLAGHDHVGGARRAAVMRRAEERVLAKLRRT